VTSASIPIVVRAPALHADSGQRGGVLSGSSAIAKSGSDGPVDFKKIGETAQATGQTVLLGPPPLARS
jgi:hypothetical protein